MEPGTPNISHDTRFNPSEAQGTEADGFSSNTSQGNALNLRLSSERAHWRSGTGNSMPVSSTSTKRTMVGLGRRALGLCLMLVTISMWTASNFLASSIFADDTYSKPFFVTWLNVGMFSLFLVGPLTRLAVTKLRTQLKDLHRRSTKRVYAPVAIDEPDDEDRSGESDLVNEGISDPSNESSTLSSRESLVLDESMVLGTHGFTAQGSDRLSLYETAKLSCEFCVLWFASNYFVSACLQYTTVASSTVLGSTSSVFTLAFGALLGAERFTVPKLISVAVCLVGVVMISQVDLSGESDENRGSFPEKTNSEMLIGDILALAGAVGYGLYTILVKKRVGDESRMDVFTFFGFIGLCDLLFLWPGLFIMHWTGIETYEAPPTGNVWWVIVANGFISLISDVCWTYSMLLTSPLVITVGLSLAIPMSLLGQMFINGQNSSLLYWIGSAVVIVSFLIVNQESKREAEEKEQAIGSAISAPTTVVGNEFASDSEPV